jgi:hypothetical protein
MRPRKFLCSLPAFLSAHQSALHACPIIQATSADLDIREDSGCLPVAQSPAADWQFRQQSFFVYEGLIFTHAITVQFQAQNRTNDFRNRLFCRNPTEIGNSIAQFSVCHFIQVIRPPLHHLSAFRQKLCIIICTTNLVPFAVCKLTFNGVPIPSVLVEKS